MAVGTPGAEMIGERELWACASTVLSQHGDGALAVVAERIGELALAGDQAGMDVWKAIAERMDKLTHLEGPTQ